MKCNLIVRDNEYTSQKIKSVTRLQIYLWFHLYKFLEQATLIYGDTNQNNSYVEKD